MLTHTMKAMTFNNTLETFTFCGTNYFNFFAFSENVNSDSVTNIFFNGIIAEFFYEFFGESIGFCEVIFFGISSVLFFFIAKSQLESIITVGFLCFNLGNYAGTSFNNGTGCLLAIWIEDAGHPNFFTNNSFHLFYGLCPARL